MKIPTKLSTLLVAIAVALTTLTLPSGMVHADDGWFAGFESSGVDRDVYVSPHDNSSPSADAQQSDHTQAGPAKDANSRFTISRVDVMQYAIASEHTGRSTSGPGAEVAFSTFVSNRDHAVALVPAGPPQGIEPPSPPGGGGGGGDKGGGGIGSGGGGPVIGGPSGIGIGRR